MALGLAGSGLLALLIPALPNLLWLAALWALEAVGLAMAVPAETAFVADLTGVSSEERATASTPSPRVWEPCVVQYYSGKRKD